MSRGKIPSKSQDEENLMKELCFEKNIARVTFALRLKVYCCRRQLHIGKRSMVFGSMVRFIVRIRKQPMKKPVI